MKKTIKRILWGIGVFFIIAIIGFCIYLNSLMPIITGYAAKHLCSDVFISGRNQSDVENLDLNFSFIKFTRNKVDTVEKSVTSRFLWGHSKAIYIDGYGSTLVRKISERELRTRRKPLPITQLYSKDTIAWPLGDVLPEVQTGINLPQLKNITDQMINKNAYNGDAFAFLVVHKGVLVAEGYKPHFNKNTRFISWSMAKSFTNALAGILQMQGKLDIYKPSGLEEWKNDDRNKITLNDLMQMQSGLKWNEDYGNRSDVTVMLHCENDMSRYAFDQPPEYPAGSHWCYSSGSCNIISRLIRRQFANDSLYYTFVRTSLFNKIGMPEAVVEVDPAGTIVGSSYLYATARDYARFGILYMNDGVFNGERILPKGWVKYSTTPASDSKKIYGSLFWLNRGKVLPSVPEDAYSCDGHDGQHIYIIPSKELIIVILGYSPSYRTGMDIDRLLKDVINTLN